MGVVDAAITTVIISVIALAGIGVMGGFVSTLSLPDGRLRPGAIAVLDGWSTAIVLAVSLLGGFGFVIIAVLASLR